MKTQMNTQVVKMLDRWEVLGQRVADERMALSSFRKNEAVYLALTPDEQIEWRDLEEVLKDLHALS